MQISTLIGSAIVAAVAVMVWFVMKIRFVDQRVVEAKRKVEEIREAAQQDAERLKKEKLVEAKDEIFTWRSEAEKDLHEGRRKFNKWERNLSRQEDNLQSKEQEILRNEKDSNRRLTKLQHRERRLAEGERNLEEVRADHIKRLEAVAGMTAEEAKNVLIQSIREQALGDAAMLAKRLEDEARETASREARKVLAQAIQRCAAEYVMESTVSVVDLPSDDMKGRIIGREGRNIRALEQATGIDLIVDDTPEAVILSGFDPLRREIARLSIERLIKDGRIHPSRIEEVVSKVKKEMKDTALQEGEEVALELGIHGIHKDPASLGGQAEISKQLRSKCPFSQQRSGLFSGTYGSRNRGRCGCVQARRAAS